MKFKNLNYCGSNEGNYEIRNPSSPNAFPNPQTLRTTFLKKIQLLTSHNNHQRKNTLQKTTEPLEPTHESMSTKYPLS